MTLITGNYAQGGTDGEALEIAGAREACEELGTNKFIFKATFPNVHRYKFNHQNQSISEDLKGTNLKIKVNRKACG